MYFKDLQEIQKNKLQINISSSLSFISDNIISINVKYKLSHWMSLIALVLTLDIGIQYNLINHSMMIEQSIEYFLQEIFVFKAYI